jgi:hypothetical protein
MRHISDSYELGQYRQLLREMMIPERLDEFTGEWVQKRGWKVVPVESGVRLQEPDIPRLVAVLNGAGSDKCIAIPTERLPGAGQYPACYAVSVDTEDFKEVNGELGPFRFLLTDWGHSWGISCNEWYNLVAARPDLLESMLGRPIKQARQEFLEFASLLADGPDYPLLMIARHYASL